MGNPLDLFVLIHAFQNADFEGNSSGDDIKFVYLRLRIDGLLAVSAIITAKDLHALIL